MNLCARSTYWHRSMHVLVLASVLSASARCEGTNFVSTKYKYALPIPQGWRLSVAANDVPSLFTMRRS
jgi:hypothetical protein